MLTQEQDTLSAGTGYYSASDYLIPLLYIVAISWYFIYWGIALVGWSTA